MNGAVYFYTLYVFILSCSFFYMACKKKSMNVFNTINCMSSFVCQFAINYTRDHDGQKCKHC